MFWMQISHSKPPKILCVHSACDVYLNSLFQYARSAIAAAAAAIALVLFT